MVEYGKRSVEEGPSSKGPEARGRREKLVYHGRARAKGAGKREVAGERVGGREV